MAEILSKDKEGITIRLTRSEANTILGIYNSLQMMNRFFSDNPEYDELNESLQDYFEEYPKH